MAVFLRILCVALLLLFFTATPKAAVREADWQSDSLIDKYLVDTARAGATIHELIGLGLKDIQNKNRSAALKKFQLALTLKPYAEDSTEVLAILYSQFSNLLFNAGASDLAIKYSKISYYYFYKTDTAPNDKVYNLLGKIGSFYLTAHQYDSASVYFNLALKEAKGIGDYLWVAAAYNNLGMLQYQLKKMEEAEQYYNKALQVLQLKTHGDSSFVCSVTDNIAAALFDKGHLDSALALHNSIISIQQLIGNNGGVFNATCRKVETLLALKRHAEAVEIIKWLESKVAVFYKHNPVEAQLKLSVLWKLYYEKTNQWVLALRMQEVISHIRDSLNDSNRKWMNETLNALTQSEIGKFRNDIRLSQVRLQQKQRELEMANSAARKNRILVVMGVLLFILLLVYLVNRSNHQKNQIKLQQVEKELIERDLSFQKLQREKLEQELNYKKGDLSNLSIYLSNLQDIYDNLLEKLHEIKTKKPAEQKEEIAQVIKEMDAQIHSSEKQSMIQENVDQVNREFYDKLLTTFPALTKSEIELCGLLKLNMSNKEIGALKNISAESVKMARYRLRKKLGLTPEEDIYRFLAGI